MYRAVLSPHARSQSGKLVAELLSDVEQYRLTSGSFGDRRASRISDIAMSRPAAVVRRDVPSGIVTTIHLAKSEESCKGRRICSTMGVVPPFPDEEVYGIPQFRR